MKKILQISLFLTFAIISPVSLAQNCTILDVTFGSKTCNSDLKFDVDVTINAIAIGQTIKITDGINDLMTNISTTGTYSITGLSGAQTLYVIDEADATCIKQSNVYSACTPCSYSSKPTDECVNAPFLDLSQAFYGSTTCSYTESNGSPTGCGSMDNDSWMKFVAGDTEVKLDITVQNTGNCGWGVQFILFSGNCNNLTAVPGTCINASTPNVGTTINWDLNGLTIGNEYYLRIDGYAGDLCDYFFTPISGVVTTPPNNLCDNAITLTCGGNTDTQSNIFATDIDKPTACAGGGTTSEGVWYKVVGTGDDLMVSTDYPATNFDTQINVFTGVCGGPWTCIGGDDNSGTNAAGSSQFIWTSVLGTDYYIYVDGSGTSKGIFEVGVSCMTCYASPADTLPTVCTNTNIPTITHTTSTTTGILNDGVDGANGLPSGVSATWSNNIISIIGTPTVAGVYNYSIPLLGSSCNNSIFAQGTITVISNPTANAGGVASICENDTYTVNNATTNINNILWTTNGQGVISNPNSITPIYTPDPQDIGTTVTLTLTTGINCPAPASDNLLLSINPNPNYNLNQNYFVCPNESLKLEVTDSLNMNSIDWKSNNNQSISNYFGHTFSAGIYNATLESQDGCFKDTTIIISTQTPVNISQLLTSTCQNTFLMTNNTGGDQNGTNGTWSFVSNDGTVTFSNNNTINTTAIFSNFGQFELIFTDNNCPLDDDTLIITYSDKPYFDFPADLFYCPGEAGLSLEITDSLNMNGVSWNYPQSSVNTIFNSTLTQGNYPIRLTNKYNCSNDTTIQIKTQASIQLIDPSNNEKLCLFNITDTLFVLASTGDTLGGSWNYTTSTNGIATFLIDSATTLFQVTEYGPYTIWFTDNVCQTADTLKFIITPGSYFEVEDYKVCNGFTQEITPNIYTPNQFIEYLEWNTGETTQNITVSSEGYYTLTISTGCGNDFSDSSFVDYRVCDIKMPNIITPNGDGVNDEYVILGEVEAFKEFSIIITNRWGNVVTTYNDINGTWDGKDQGGKAVEDGVYFYTVQAVTIEDVPISKQGFIQVINN